MGKIKILFTIPNFKTAGSQFVLLALYNKINKALFDPYVCVESFPEEIPSYISKEKRLQFNFTGRNIQDIINFRKILKYNDIAIVHSWDYKSNFIEALACQLSGVKYLYTKKNNTWSKRWNLKSFISHHIAYDNPEMKLRFFSTFFFKNKTSFIPHGVDSSIFFPLKKQDNLMFDIGCIGNINSNKNQLFIIKALNRLPSKIVLHLYGNENAQYRKLLNTYIRNNKLENRVHFHGYIENANMPKIINDLDLFVLASINEGLPVSILESMACGVSILSSDSGGGAKFLLKTEDIFSLNDPEDLIQKILKISLMDKNKRIAENLKTVEHTVKNHSIETEVMAYENLYINMLP